MMLHTIRSIIKWTALFIVCPVILASCKHNDEGQKESPATGSNIWPVLYNGSGSNQQFINVFIYENMTTVVQSILNDGSMGSFEERTDYEYLTCSRIPDGFVLKNPNSGEILYTALNDHTDNWDEYSDLPMAIILNWSHSPGPVWDTYAQDRGWQSELRLEMVIQNLDDIKNF